MEQYSPFYPKLTVDQLEQHLSRAEQRLDRFHRQQVRDNAPEAVLIERQNHHDQLLTRVEYLIELIDQKSRSTSRSLPSPIEMVRAGTRLVVSSFGGRI